MPIAEIRNRMKEIEVLKIVGIPEYDELERYRELARKLLFGTHEAMESFYDLASNKSAEEVRMILNHAQATAV